LEEEMRIDRVFPFFHRDTKGKQEKVIEEAFADGTISSDDAEMLTKAIQITEKEKKR
jgi:hypothetical protein